MAEIKKIQIGQKVYIKDYGKTIVGYWNWILKNQIVPKYYTKDTKLKREDVEAKTAVVKFMAKRLPFTTTKGVIKSKQMLYFLEGKDFEVIAPKEAFEVLDKLNKDK